jgi:hypothetical protein
LLDTLSDNLFDLVHEARVAAQLPALHRLPDQFPLAAGYRIAYEIPIPLRGTFFIFTACDGARQWIKPRIVAIFLPAVEAGPQILLRCGDHAGADRIELDVADAGQQVAVGLDRTGLVAALP